MKRVIYSLYVDVPAKEHYGDSKIKYDTAEKASVTVNAFKKHYQKLIDSKKKYAKSIGADFVMLGSMLAGHEESGGELITENDKQYKIFYGMSSDTAMNKHSGGVAEYRSSEGRTVDIPFRGSVVDTVGNILGGLRSTCTYVGAPSLKQLSKCTTFVRCTQQFNAVFVN